MKKRIVLLACLLPFAAVAQGKLSAPPPPPRQAPAPGQSMNADALARYRDAVAKVGAGAYGPATVVLNGLAAEYPHVGEIFATRCSAQLGLSHFPQAEADCAYALSRRSTLSSALYGLAAAEEGQGKAALAARHYRQYAALDDPQATYKAQALARVSALEGPSAHDLPVAPPPSVGTAPSPQTQAQQQPAGQVGTLYVYRNRYFGGGGFGYTGARQISQIVLYLDGQMVGEIAHDHYVELQLAPGSRLLEARFSTDHVFAVPRVLTLPVEVTANGQRYVNFDTVGGQLMLREVAADQARREIREDCKKAYSRRL